MILGFSGENKEGVCKNSSIVGVIVIFTRSVKPTRTTDKLSTMRLLFAACLFLARIVRFTSALSIKSSAFAAAYIDVMGRFREVGPLENVELEGRFESATGRIGNNVEVTFCSEAFRSSELSYARMVSFSGKGYDVFNFLAIPAIDCDLPMFGVDLVMLPGGVLAAIDFQPTSGLDSHTRGHAYESVKPLFDSWQPMFPSGGPLPPAARRFFSPCAIWTRFGKSGGEADGVLFEKMLQAMSQYCQVYCDVLKSVKETAKEGGDEERKERVQFLSDYLQYRIDNDPAKKMLVGAFGETWTDEVLKRVLFPKVF